MFVALWEFDVKPGCEGRFESIYGPRGDWARLFRRDPSYRETILLRDAARERIYVTCDYWESREAYKAFQGANSEAYRALYKSCEELTIAERKIGEFERLA
jgi:heme-degrading monooxygenase HmoA